MVKENSKPGPSPMTDDKRRLFRRKKRREGWWRRFLKRLAETNQKMGVCKS